MPYKMLAIFLMQGTAHHTFFINEPEELLEMALVVPARMIKIGAPRRARGQIFTPRSERGPYVQRHSHRRSGLKQATPPA
jgi:hypothetical protein